MNYLKFWFTAKNQHGIHSPFMYDFVTKGLYTKKKFSQSTSLDVFLKCIHYFQPKNIELKNGHKLIKKKVITEFPTVGFNEPYDMIYYGELLSETEISSMAEYAKKQPGGILFIDEIRKNKNSKELWQKLLQTSFHVVTVDMYYCGLLFFHTTQAKEHFKIRV